MAVYSQGNMGRAVEAELRRLLRKRGDSIAILREAMIRGVMIGISWQIARPEPGEIEIPSMMN